MTLVVQIEYAETMHCCRCDTEVGTPGVHVVEEGAYQGTSWCASCWDVLSRTLDRMADEYQEGD